MNLYPTNLLRYLLALMIALTPILPQLTMAMGEQAGMDHAVMNVTVAVQLHAEHEAMSLMGKTQAEMTCDTECTGCSGSGQCSTVAIVSDTSLHILPLAQPRLYFGHQSHRSASRVPEPDPPRIH